jgi:hypothetical protein
LADFNVLMFSEFVFYLTTLFRILCEIFKLWKFQLCNLLGDF